MKTHNFTLINCDTDSITFSKADGSVISKDEQDFLLDELNSLYPENIKFEHDGYFPSFVVVKAKNYIMLDDKGTLKIKGSSMKSLKTESIMKDMIQEIVKALIEHRLEDIDVIYKKYVKMAKAPTDIMQWSKKATITKPILNCKGYVEQDILDKKIRRNETEVYDAIANIHVQEGDRVQLYPAILSKQVIQAPIMRKNKATDEHETKGYKEEIKIKYGLKLVSNYNNDADTEHLVKRVHATLNIFKTILDMSQYLNYSLNKNKKALEEL
jgi:hypothetical protein